MARHPSVESVTRYFSKLPVADDGTKERMDEIRGLCADLATEILNTIPEDHPELTLGLHKLVEAKDCFVRAVL
jgi:hypothetical protein